MAEGTASVQIPASMTPVIPKVPGTETTGSAPKAGEGQDKKPDNPFKGSKHKVTIDGAVSEIEYDELLAGYQREKASQKRFQEAQQIKSAASELFQSLGQGDQKAWDWLKANVPKDVFKKVAFDFAYQEMEHDALPEDKKRELELNERERRLKEEEERREKEAQHQKWQAEVSSAGEYIQKQLDEFTKRSGQTPSTEQLYRMSEYMLAYMSKHSEMPSVDKLFEYTEKQLDMDTLSHLKKKGSDVKSLLKWLPPDLVKSIKKALIEEAESTLPKRGGSRDESRGVSRSKEGAKVGIDEAFQILEKRMKKRS